MTRVAAVDPLRITAKLKSRTAGTPFRQDQRPTPVAKVNPADPTDAVAEIMSRIRWLRRKGAGAYVFIDDDRRAYVVSEEQDAAVCWVKEHFRWCVGFYRLVHPKDPSIPVLRPTVEGITEDVLEQVKP